MGPTLGLARLTAALVACLAFSSTFAGEREESLLLHDVSRQRDVPVQLYHPPTEVACQAPGECPVALLSPGYGESHLAYSFLAKALNNAGVLVVSLQQDLPSDAPLPREGDLLTLRAPFWQRGVDNLLFVRAQLQHRFPTYNWAQPLLVGHSNGGDTAVWLSHRHPNIPAALITLDHRRAPLLRAQRPRILSIRGSDYPADPGVLPTAEEQARYGLSIVEIPDAKHNEMVDDGPEALKQAIAKLCLAFLQSLRTNSPRY
ncbi:alpha/beta hydrolase [Paucibacter sp. KBW04]|uniref:alpha/beta hydrolase n=1 Tax=Paucibacter sp. KBW04 TaxID=2153361 RepID=UPI000F589291|nr:alpha/beta hydrolase [Paucibacter sp. KBW04]RQO53485.1 alpha/beta hydrolase [Paucibacter sp. KBW04]